MEYNGVHVGISSADGVLVYDRSLQEGIEVGQVRLWRERDRVLIIYDRASLKGHTRPTNAADKIDYSLSWRRMNRDELLRESRVVCFVPSTNQLPPIPRRDDSHDILVQTNGEVLKRNAIFDFDIDPYGGALLGADNEDAHN